jgi:hypothetical protein
MLSFRSHVKLIPEEGSNDASEGILGRRHPDSVFNHKAQISHNE